MSDAAAELDAGPSARTGGAPGIAEMLAAEPDRLERMSGEIAGLYFDFSKSLASADDVARLRDRAAASDFDLWRARLAGGDMFNHPLTDRGIEGFLADWAKTGQTIG